MTFKKWVKNIQTAGYNGACTVVAKSLNRTIRIQAFLISKVYLEINFTRKVKQLPTYWFFLLQPWRKRSGSFVMFYICFSFMFPFFLLGYFLASFFVASHSQECLQQTIEVFYESVLKVWQFVISSCHPLMFFQKWHNRIKSLIEVRVYGRV